MSVWPSYLTRDARTNLSPSLSAGQSARSGGCLLSSSAPLASVTDRGYMSRKLRKLRINSMHETNENFDSYNSCKWLVLSRIHELHESKMSFVSRIEFIGSKLSKFSAHVSAVAVGIVLDVVSSVLVLSVLAAFSAVGRTAYPVLAPSARLFALVSWIARSVRILMHACFYRGFCGVCVAGEALPVAVRCVWSTGPGGCT